MLYTRGAFPHQFPTHFHLKIGAETPKRHLISRRVISISIGSQLWE